MARRVYLHIGTMKAATTYLQNLCDVNRGLLAEHGLLWQGGRFNQYAIHDFQKSSMLPPQEKGAFRRFRDQVRQEPGDVLVSMELLAKLRSDRIAKLVEQLGAEEYVVMLTARDLTRVTTSHWQETTQNMGTVPWAQWIAEVCDVEPSASDTSPFWRHHYLPRILDEWAGVAGPERTHLVTIPQSKSDPEAVWRRFASVIGVPAERATQPSFSNAAIGATSAELMRRLNVELSGTPFNQYRWGFKAALAKQTLARRAGEEPRVGLSAEQHARLSSIAADMVEQVKQRDVDVVGDLSDLMPPAQPPGPAYDPGQASDAELLEAAMAGLLGLGKRAAKQRIEIQRLERDAAAAPRADGADGLGARARRLTALPGRAAQRRRRR